MRTLVAACRLTSSTPNPGWLRVKVPAFYVGVDDVDAFAAALAERWHPGEDAREALAGSDRGGSAVGSAHLAVDAIAQGWLHRRVSHVAVDVATRLGPHIESRVSERER